MTPVSTAGPNDVEVNDLGPLAWVLEELHKSLDGATKAIRRFVRDAELSRGSDISELDASQLRIARQQLHQAVGALEMVGMEVPAKMLRSMEGLAQKFVQRPEMCSEVAAGAVENASFALTEYLEGMLKGKTASSVALFPQYRAVQELIGAERIHPADLWTVGWRWLSVAPPQGAAALEYAPGVRSQMDRAVLKLVKTGDIEGAKTLEAVCLGLAAGQVTLQSRTFWTLCAAYFEAMVQGLCPSDGYTKRVGSRILQQYASLAKGDPVVSDRLAHDVLFFCALSVPSPAQPAPMLDLVRRTYGLGNSKAVDYETPQFGRFDPALLVLARKRIAAAAETWSALAGGDTHRIKVASEQFASVADSMIKLHPENRDLARALIQAVDATVLSGVAPLPAVAMEVATAVLYLEAAYEDLDPTDSQLAERSASLAKRLAHVCGGGEPEPMESWMEELYRRVSDRQTMGSVVDELRTALGHVEKSLDQFFRHPEDTSPLREVPSQLSQMRGVFSVLGLDQPSLAALRIRANIEQFLLDGVQNPEARQGVFEKLGNSLGAMGFLIDMLGYQRAMAKKLFVYDEELGEFRPLMGRERVTAPEPESVPAAAVVAAPVPVPAPVVAPKTMPGPASQQVPAPAAAVLPPVPVPTQPSPVAKPAAPVDDASDDDSELQEIFLDEAREVVHNGLAALQALATDASNLADQTTLRRAFHTLKGSSRMVGLTEFGEAAWSFEQMLNASLAEQRPATDALIDLAGQAMHAFGRWVEDIAQHTAQDWVAQDFRKSSDALRLKGTLLPLRTPGDLPTAGAPPVAAPAAAAAPIVQAAPSAVPGLHAPAKDAEEPDSRPDFAATQMGEAPGPAAAGPAPDFAATQFGQSFDFQSTQIFAADSGGAQRAAASDLAQQKANDLSLDMGEFDFSDMGATVEPVAESVASDPDFADTSPPDFEPAPAIEAAGEPAFAPEIRPEPDARHLVQAEPVLAPEPVLQAEALFASDAASEPETVPKPEPESELFEDLVLPSDAAIAPAVDTLPAAASLDLHHLEFPVPEPEPLLPDLPPSEPFSAADLVFPSASQASGIDLGDLSLEFNDEPATASAPASASATEAPLPVLVPDTEPEPVPEPEPDPAVVSAVESPEDIDRDDDQTKVIGSLRLSIPLYNVYLNEADEWSRRLQVELSEWAMELHKTLPEAAVNLAHSLAGSSGTVGFMALSNLARALEHALQHVQLHQQGTPEHAGVFVDAAEDIRRLLHQFAAGFLKEPNADIVQSLHDIIETEFAAPELDQLSDEPDLALPERALAAEQVVPASESPSDLELDFDFVAPSEPLAQDATSMPVAPLPAATALAVAVPEASDALPMIDASDDEMDAVDQLDPDLFPIFEEEAADLLPNLGGALREWVARPENVAARSQALRLLHTLKGSSRLAGALRIGEMSHRMESSIEHIGSEDLQTTQIEPLLTRFDTLQASFDRLTQPPQALVLPMGEAVAEGTAAAVVEPSDLSAPVPVPAMPQLRQSGNQSVRVRSQLLERLVNQAGEVMITRSRMDARLGQFRASLDDLDGNLERLRKQLRDVEVQAESQMQSRLAQTKELSHSFDPLEFDRFTRLQELTRMMAESVNDVATVQRNLQRAVEGTEDDLIAQGRQARELQRDLLRTRMVEFEAISERLYGVVRQAAKDTGKQVKLDIVGGSIDIDRGVLERIAPAFEHLLRNAVAHGIESAAVRAAAGKAPVGTIQICVSQASNDVSVEFRDDGGGLPLEKIRAKAVAGGLLAADAVLSDEQAANLVFLPGLSTADQITEVAGRGIGMDVVRSEVLGLGGRIETSTRSGQGAVFKLVLPLTTAVTQVVMLRMGEFTMGVPSNLMETVLRVPATVVEQAYEAQVFDMGVENIPFFWAGSLLQISARSSELHGKTLPVAVFRSAGQRLALHVDEVLGNREVVVKNLGPQLGRLPGLAGISVLASGAVALIYNPVALASVYGEQAQHLRLSSAVANPAAGSGAAGAGSVAAAPLVSEVPLILVVDDSITVRRVTQRLLKREGYRVALAADGLQALERLQDEKPTVVLSDIEMPRMDGFDLARNIRGDANLRDLPIIMITSRIAEKHHQHAKELGVDHYLGKPYSEDELLGLVRDYCAVRA